MGVYQRVTDGLLYSLKWVQERLTDPPVLNAVAQDVVGKTLRNADRMDFVTLSPEARRRTAVRPLEGASGSGGVDK